MSLTTITIKVLAGSAAINSVGEEEEAQSIYGLRWSSKHKEDEPELQVIGRKWTDASSS